MSQIFNKISSTAFKELQVEAGMILKSFTPANPTTPDDSAIVCVTSGGINAQCIPTYSDFGDDIDNCPANTKELKRLDGWECKLAFTALSVTVDTIKLALGAATSDSSTHKVTPSAELESTHFADSIWFVGDKVGGGMVAICLKNALSTGGFSLQTTKKGKGQLSVELTGHVSINSQSTVPMEFYATEGT